MKKSPYLKHNKEKNLFNLIQYNKRHSLPVEIPIEQLATITATRVINRNVRRVKQFACIKYLKSDLRVLNPFKRTPNKMKLLDFIKDKTIFKTKSMFNGNKIST